MSSSSASAGPFPIAASKKEATPEHAAQPGSIPLNELADDVVMSRLQAGEVAALEVLYDRYARLLLGLGARILRNSTEAEDVVQEVFLYLFRKNHFFDLSKGNVRSWLVQVTYSRAFNRYHYLKSRSYYDRGNDECQKRSLADDKMLSPEEIREMSYWRGHLLEAFRELTTEQRETLQLFFFEGYTLLEISQKTGHSFGNIRNHYYRGLERLRKVLSRNGNGTQNK